MSFALPLHRFIEAHNVLERPTAAISHFLHENPRLYRMALVINHLFRAVSMAAFMAFLPWSWPVSTAACFGGALFYRLTVETNCAYKFALPSFFGSIALALSLWKPLLGAIPLGAYFAYVVLTVEHDVNAQTGRV